MISNQQALLDASAAIANGKRVALATVIRAVGSTPRHRGAKMAVTLDEQWGTIGGGRIEFEVVNALRDCIRRNQGQRFERHLVRDLAMCCGGTMTLALVVLDGENRNAVVQAAEAISAGCTGWLVVHHDGSALEFHSAEVLDERDRLFSERLDLPPRAVLFGLGHVSRKTGPLLAEVGFEVVVCDDGETIAASDFIKPTWASCLVESFDVATVERKLAGFSQRDYLLILTRDHALDQRLLEELLLTPATAFLGMIGSRGKVARFVQRLIAKDIITDANDPRWQRVVAPIGLNIGAETPAEIAVAIVAQLIAKLRCGQQTASDWAASLGESKRASDKRDPAVSTEASR